MRKIRLCVEDKLGIICLPKYLFLKKQSFSPGIGVDLGLTSGTLWADRNIGASSEVDKGGEFVWGSYWNQ